MLSAKVGVGSFVCVYLGRRCAGKGFDRIVSPSMLGIVLKSI